MAITDMKVFNKFVIEATVETVNQDIDKFNAASNGTIILSAEGFEGDFMNKSMFKGLQNAQRRVDRYGTNAAQAATALAQIKDSSVKVGGGFGPILWEPGQLSWMQMNEVDAITALSKNLSEAIIQDQLNSGILAAVAAIGNNANMTEDGTAAGLSQTALNKSHSRFGDRSLSLAAQVMTGAAYHALIGEALTNSNTLFRQDNVLVVDILNKPVIVTDSPALVTTGGTPASIGHVLSLADTGIVISNAADLITNIETTNGKQRIETTFQADYTFGLGIKGYAWDEANGGKSPEDAEIGTGTNWDKYVSSDKDTAGVLLNYDTSK